MLGEMAYGAHSHMHSDQRDNGVAEQLFHILLLMLDPRKLCYHCSGH